MMRRWSIAAAVTAAVVIAACESRSPMPAAPQSPSRLLGGVLGKVQLLACTPVAADSTTITIGPDGGTIVVGPHALVVPPGALDSAVAITAIAPSDTVNRVTLLPSGLVFNHPATLTLSYANCGSIGDLLHRIVYIDGSLSLLDVLPTLDDVLNQQVSTNLHHFSDYAIAW
jgi:hypothetical protein